MPIHPLGWEACPQRIAGRCGEAGAGVSSAQPDMSDANQRVAFGTSGHRGTSLNGSFTEAHILAITQAICEYRVLKNIDGPVYVGKDSHAASGPAQHCA